MFNPNARRVNDYNTACTMREALVTINKVNRVMRPVALSSGQTFVRAKPCLLPYLESISTEIRNLLLSDRRIFLRFNRPSIRPIIRAIRRRVEHTIVVGGREIIGTFLVNGRQFLLALNG